MVLELAATEKVFRRLPYGFWDFRVFIVAEVGQKEPREPYYPPGRARGPWRALVDSAHLLHPLVLPRSL